MPGLLLILHFLVPVRGLVISQSGVKLKPDKHNIVEYKINKKAFGFQKKATVNVTVTCVSSICFFFFTTKPELLITSCILAIGKILKLEIFSCM